MSEQPTQHPQASKAASQRSEAADRQHLEIEQFLQSRETPADESVFDFLQGKYVFRFPFLINSINWGCGLGTVFGLHTYFRTRSVSNALYWFTAAGMLTGLPIFGFFLFRYTFYSTSIKRFEKEQSLMIEESKTKRSYVMKKLRAKSEDISDEALMEQLLEEKERLFQHYSMLSAIIPDRDF